MKVPVDDCFLHDKDRLSHDEALALLREGATAVQNGVETVDLREALNRVLASPIPSPFDMPGHTNAAVDGYAYRHADGRTLLVEGRISAGMSPPALQAERAARIFTGAPLPKGADTVAMQEDCARLEDEVFLPDLKKGSNVRDRGEDVVKGGTLVPASRRLGPADIASAAAAGLDRLHVRSRLRVTLFSSGNEIRNAGTLLHGQVFDTNRPMLNAWMSRLPVSVCDGGVLADDAIAVQEALSKAASHSDVVMTTGGASLGEEDHMLATLDRLGRRKAWQIAVKPGRPLMFGHIGDCLYLGLPGNPVAAAVCYLLYARPLLLSLAGAGWHEPLRMTLPAAFEARSKPDRREFQRGTVGKSGVEAYARTGSGLLSSLRESDGLIEIPEDVTRIERGDPVAFLPWQSFL